MRKFPAYSRQDDPVKETNKRIQLLRAKYFIAGGNARHMFEASTAMAIEELDNAIPKAPDLVPYLRGYVGDSLSPNYGAVSLLFARYESSDVRLVSEYVVRHFATVMGPHLVENFARACNVYPSTGGFILEAWFFAQLSHNGLTWSVYVESTLQCGELEVVETSSDGCIRMPSFLEFSRIASAGARYSSILEYTKILPATVPSFHNPTIPTA